MKGAFVAAPIGGLLWGFGACALRLGTLFILSKIQGRRFDALDRPRPHLRSLETYDENEHEQVLASDAKNGTFF